MKTSIATFVCSVMLVCCQRILTSSISGAKPRIFIGREAKQHEFPFTVSLSTENSGHFCGGTIIHEKWILTAAYCVENSNFNITAAEHSTRFEEGAEQIVRPREVIQYFDSIEEAGLHDIALVRVYPNFKFNRFIESMPLPSRRFTATGNATVIGWGRTKWANGLDYTDMVSATPRKISLPILRSSLCQDRYGYHFNHLTQLCVENTDDVCLMEFGGPLMCNTRAHNNSVDTDKTAFCGILSYGSDCGRGRPGIYTRVSFYRDWIEENIPDLQTDLCDRSLTTPLYRYDIENSTHHLYTTNRNETLGGSIRYKFIRDEARIFPTKGPKMTPLHRLKHTQNGDNLYTRHESHVQLLRTPGKEEGYLYKGITGYVYPTKVRGSIELYRYFDLSSSDHVYTTDWNDLGEGSDLGQGYYREGKTISIFVCPP